jgi:hypothetical protein
MSDFDSLDKAIAAEETPDESLTSDSEVTEVVDNDDADPDPVPSKAATRADLADDTLITLTVQGKEVQKTLKQLKAEGMMQEDYSRKTARLAERERQIENESRQKHQEIERYTKALEERASQLQTLLKNPRLLMQEAMRQGVIPPAGGTRRTPAPDDIVTYADMQRMGASDRESLVAEARRAAQEEATQVRAEIEEARFTNELVTSTDRTLKSILDENPILQDVPYIDQAIKREASKANPRDIESTIEALVEAGKTIAERYNKKFKSDQKEAAIRSQKLKNQGIEPPGGAAPAPAKKTYGKGRKVDWSALDRDAEAFVASRLGK